LVILFIFFGLLLGVVLREVNKKTRFPYTPMVVIAGMLLGYYRDSLGVIGDSTTILSGINPHMLLFIFIPVLIFESGFNCDWYIFKRAIVNILILACPGVLIGGVILGYGEEPEITWPAAMMMGSILSATDPVAVVALLKELGASVRLGTLIEGESLLNDGTAMVFYQLFLGITKG
jgi:NhaP-type Na+/H+ or K+/H+ antiporter